MFLSSVLGSSNPSSAFNLLPFLANASTAAVAARPAQSKSQELWNSRQAYIKGGDEWVETHAWIKTRAGNEDGAVANFIKNDMPKFKFHKNGIADLELLDSTPENISQINTRPNETLSMKLVTAMFWAADAPGGQWDRKISHEEWQKAFGA